MFRISNQYFIVTVILHFYILLHFTGQDFTAAQRERAQEDFRVLFKGVSPHPPPHSHIATATAPVHNLHFFRIVREFFCVPQNYQYSRICETRPPTYRSYPRRLESLTMKLRRQHFLLSYLKTPSDGPVGVSNSRPPASQPGAQPSEPPVRGYFALPIKSHSG